MPLHREVPQTLLTARPFTPLDRSSSTLPFLSFQSLTIIKFSNPLVLITIRNAGGVGRANRNLLKKKFNSAVSSTLVPRICVSQHPDLASGHRRCVRRFFPPPSLSKPSNLPTFQLPNNPVSIIPFVINHFRTLSRKHPGMGVGLSIEDLPLRVPPLAGP
jgi:hypothetical protein